MKAARLQLRKRLMPATPVRHTYKIRAKVWLYPGAAAWHFITLPPEKSAEIVFLATPLKSAWGSVRVTATIGETSWSTSIFPDKRRGAYLLPLKSSVRKTQNIKLGDTVSATIELTVSGHSKQKK